MLYRTFFSGTVTGVKLCLTLRQTSVSGHGALTEPLSTEQPVFSFAPFRYTYERGLHFPGLATVGFFSDDDRRSSPEKNPTVANPLLSPLHFRAISGILEAIQQSQETEHRHVSFHLIHLPIMRERDRLRAAAICKMAP